jgi:hypothetical protein
MSPNQQSDKILSELEESGKQLEEAMRRVSLVQWGSAKVVETCKKLENDSVAGPRSPEVGSTYVEIYNHSYKPIGPQWVWISKASAI